MDKITDTIIPFKTPLKLPNILRPVAKLTVSMQIGHAEIYNDGTNSIAVPIWGYNGKYPGPMIEVERDQTITVEWKNKICETETLPCVVEDIAFDDSPLATDPASTKDPIPQNIVEPVTTDPSTPPIQAFLSTHLHGGKTPPGSDGWPQSMLLPLNHKTGETQSCLCRYENKQRAMMLWFHDHAMHTTRLNNFVGLAGLWVIRDEEEKKITVLPKDECEIPLIIQDRNLAGFNGFGDDQQPVTFRHRVEHGSGPLEFFGPLTLVNGAIWPRAEVDSSAYRLRILNGSNSRFYRLRFAEKVGEDKYEWLNCLPVKQIGTDCGLMDKSVDLPCRSLTLSPAERADLIVDFSDYAGKEIVLLNTAEAPFANGDPLPLDEMFPATPAHHKIKSGVDNDGNDIYEPWRTPYPQVMMFAVACDKSQSKSKQSRSCFDFDKLDQLMGKHIKSYKDEDPTDKDIAAVRTVVLIEKTETHHCKEKVVLVEWELERKDKVLPDTAMPLLKAQRELTIDGEEFVVTAERFEDPVNWMVKLNTTEKWRFINLTGDTHPMHVHLVQYKAINRQGVSIIGKSDEEDNVDFVNRMSQDNNAISLCTLPKTSPETSTATCPKSTISIDDNEKGFKDTIRVNPDEMVEIVATFEGYCGRYVYHCHLLEHEDHDMMRQFIVIRDDMNMNMHGLPISVGTKTP